MTRTALLRAAVAPLLAAALGLAGRYRPRRPRRPRTRPPPVAAAPRGRRRPSDATGPVRIDVGRFEPRTVTPGAAGHGHRHADQHRHRRRSPTSASGCSAATSSPPAPSWPPPTATPTRPPRSLPAFQAGARRAGARRRARLQLHRRLRRAAHGPGRRLPGAAQRQRHRRTATSSGGWASCPPTWCSSRSSRPPGPRSAWLWPLVERTHRAASGDFRRRRPGRRRSAAGGRLDRALAVHRAAARHAVAGRHRRPCRRSR